MAPTRLRPSAVLLILAFAPAAACGRPASDRAAPDADVAWVASATQDEAERVRPTGRDAGGPHSAEPDIDPAVAAQLETFREGLAAVAGLASDAPRDRDALVLRFIDALAAHDTTQARALHISRAEFAYLYFPTSIYTRPPYRQDPALRWFLLAQASEKGIGRALDRLGGRDLGYEGILCPAGATAQRGLRIWDDCTVRIDRGSGAESLRLFGAILEHGGRFKFLSYANDL